MTKEQNESQAPAPPETPESPDPPARMPIAVKHDGAQVLGPIEQLIAPSSNGANISGGVTVSGHHHYVRGNRKGIVGVGEGGDIPALSDHAHLSLIVDDPDSAKPGEDWVQWLLQGNASSGGPTTLTLFSVPHHGNTNADQQTAAHADHESDRHIQRVYIKDGYISHTICAGQTRLHVHGDGTLVFHAQGKAPINIVEALESIGKGGGGGGVDDAMLKGVIEQVEALKLTLRHVQAGQFRLQNIIGELAHRVDALEGRSRSTQPDPRDDRDSDVNRAIDEAIERVRQMDPREMATGYHRLDPTQRAQRARLIAEAKLTAIKLAEMLVRIDE